MFSNCQTNTFLRHFKVRQYTINSPLEVLPKEGKIYILYGIECIFLVSLVRIHHDKHHISIHLKHSEFCNLEDSGYCSSFRLDQVRVFQHIYGIFGLESI